MVNGVGRGKRGEGGGGDGDGSGGVGCACEGGDGVDLVEGDDAGKGWLVLGRDPAWLIVVPQQKTFEFLSLLKRNSPPIFDMG